MRSSTALRSIPITRSAAASSSDSPGGDADVAQDRGHDAGPRFQQRRQQVLGADVRVAQLPGVLLGADDHLAGRRSEPFEHV